MLGILDLGGWTGEMGVRESLFSGDETEKMKSWWSACFACRRPGFDPQHHMIPGTQPGVLPTPVPSQEHRLSTTSCGP